MSDSELKLLKVGVGMMNVGCILMLIPVLGFLVVFAGIIIAGFL